MYKRQDLISRLQNDIPGVQIYICSIIVPSDAAIAKKPALTGVTAYNAALQQLAVQLNLVYVDASSLIRPDLYAPVSYTHLDVYKRQDITGITV